MRAHTPQGLGDSQRRRSSTSGGNRMSMGSAIPRAQSRVWNQLSCRAISLVYNWHYLTVIY